jgi:rhamnogalacturonyl hydrolase YesR
MGPLFCGALVASVAGTMPAAAGHQTMLLQDPAAVAERVAKSMLLHPTYTQPGCATKPDGGGCCFQCWGYCGGLVINGLLRASTTAGETPPLLSAATAEAAQRFVSGRLNHFLLPGKAGGMILDGATSPSTDTGDCGDNWVFGINYLDRHTRSHPVNNSNTHDLELAILLGRNFSVQCPDRLPDSARTFARRDGAGANGVWPSTAQPNYVWADGSFMAMALPARLAAAAPADPARASWVEELTAMHLDGYDRYLRDPVDGVYHHGYNHINRTVSCCKWGRANGWLMMSKLELLLAASAIEAAGANPVHRSGALEISLFKHGQSLCKLRSHTDGRLHQLINESSAFLETSSTAMTLTALATAAARGLIPRADWVTPCVHDLWRGLSGVVAADGSVTGICEGGGFYPNASDYKARPTAYVASACGGLGTVLYAADAMREFAQHSTRDVMMY